MPEAGETVPAWLRGRGRVVRAVVTDVEGSAPFRPGATMYIGENGGIEGSLTAGCVESALVGEADSILAGGVDARRLVYGVSDELAGTVGLACGGTVHVFVHELHGEAFAAVQRQLACTAHGIPVALATVLDGDQAGAVVAIGGDGTPLAGCLGGPPLLEHGVIRDAAALLGASMAATRRYGPDGSELATGCTVHIGVWAAPPRMAIIGAVDFSAALADLAAQLGYAVTIVDPRSRFASSRRFSRSATVLVGWPEELFAAWEPGPRDAVLVFTHDPKLDVRALAAALDTDVGYIGALGSRRTTRDRNDRLREAGVDADRLARLSAPCGIDLGGSTPAETALSVLAEILAARNGRSGRSLASSSGPIHARPPALAAGEGRSGREPLEPVAQPRSRVAKRSR